VPLSKATRLSTVNPIKHCSAGATMLEQFDRDAARGTAYQMQHEGPRAQNEPAGCGHALARPACLRGVGWPKAESVEGKRKQSSMGRVLLAN
jgi:hypothetical protein